MGKRIKNFFHKDANNVGDRSCGPAKYFFSGEVASENLNADKTGQEVKIFGGGSIFDQLRGVEKKGLLISWGVGIPPKGKRDQDVSDVVDRFDMFSTRNYDWRDEIRFVPCVSCMSSYFDDAPDPLHDFVVFAHRKKTPELEAPVGVPFMTNRNRSMSEAIDFISSGEVVVTSSYHGVYWAQLLGRKVLCIPFNNKFYTMEDSPYFSTIETWTRDLGKAKRHVSKLGEYRELNIDFSKDVEMLMADEANA